MDKKISLKDVAQRVGVSAALVSYVLNGKEKEARVSTQMAGKIREAAAALNYQPNLIAKSLKSGKTHTIGLIVADISNPFFSNIARIIEDEAKKSGYVVIFGSSDENAEKQQDVINVMLNRLVDAFIITPAVNTEKQIKELKKRNVPVVLIDRYFIDMETDSVRNDNFEAAAKAVQQLIKNNRNKIAMLAYSTTLQHMQERKNGYKAALKAHGIKYKSAWLLEASYEHIEQDVASLITSLLKPLQVDAFLFATNSLAVAGLKKINELGIKVPEELAVISFDQTEAFDFFYSPVTYVNQSVPVLAKEAVKLIIARLENPALKPASIVVNTTLIIRESCGIKTKKKKTFHLA